MSKKLMPTTCQTQMFTQEDFHAKTYQWLEGVKDWMENDLDSGSSFIELLRKFSQDGLLSRTSPACSVPMKGEILASCLEDLPESYQKFLKQAGGTQDLLKDQSIQSPIAFSMHSILEYHSAAAACSLSEVLETDVPQKYFLSARAARGILRRAEKRGRELPPVLREALLQVVESTNRDEGGKTT